MQIAEESVFFDKEEHEIVLVASEGKSGSMAFYLHLPSGEVLKKGYASSGRAVFNICVDGLYKAVFFYRKPNNIVESVERWFFLHIDGFLKKINDVCLYETKDNKVVYYKTGSKCLFVVFNGTATNKKSAPFGLRFLLKRGFDVIVVYQDNDTQYQSLSGDQLEKIVRDHIKNKRVICYGASLGGYCAVYYGGYLNAEIIAASPKNSAHPDLVAKNKNSRFSKDLWKHSSIVEAPKSGKNVSIIVDLNYSSDRFFLEKYVIPAYPKAKIINCEFSGHRSLAHLKDTKQLSFVFDSVVSGKTPVLNGKDSFYTCIEKAKHYYRKKDLPMATFYFVKSSVFDIGSGFKRNMYNSVSNLLLNAIKD